MAENNITEIEGDLFDAPSDAALIHACNCMGSWGAGIARVFATKVRHAYLKLSADLIKLSFSQYPAAYKIYRDHCKKYLSQPEHRVVSTSPSRQAKLPEGTTLIIPPQEKDYRKGSKRHWIVCLFTSPQFGRNVSAVDIILENTELAVADMKRQLEDLGPGQVGELWACRFNSGLFGVDWKLSRKALESSGLQVTVARPEGEEE
ncbi:ADP-ribose 1''-phosphate phosphatase [Aspergillus nanangensis]|uniref:ADP-ribose 1''-phosphate phosphatase n=1 Tax=Aspergillus nanangensis TaxID=2582783 RepID=A0AAD4GQI6_ASPNN|nr:ADP-ribose 1''-phosphate phosphatase [Aspergillus nanangensis]